MLFLGLVLSLGGGLGYTAVKESVDSSVRGAKGVIALLQNPPLSVIPYMDNSQDLARKNRIKRRLVIALVAGLIVGLVVINFVWGPLDVLWFRSIRKVNSVVG